MQTLTALDSNMTFTSPSTTGPFCRLMTAALLPTSGNTWKTAQRCVHHLFNQRICVTWYVHVWHSLCSSPVWHTHTGTPALSSQLPSPWDRCHYLYPHLGARQSRYSDRHTQRYESEGSAGLASFTCYGVDADALDPEAFRWGQLSVELALHDLVVPHVPAL